MSDLKKVELGRYALSELCTTDEHMTVTQFMQELLRYCSHYGTDPEKTFIYTDFDYSDDGYTFRDLQFARHETPEEQKLREVNEELRRIRRAEQEEARERLLFEQLRQKFDEGG